MKFRWGTFLIALIMMSIGVHLLHQTLSYTVIIGIWLIAFATSQHFWKEDNND